MSHDDPTQQALAHAFDSGAVAVPDTGPITVLRARAGAGLLRLPAARAHCEQSFRPYAAALEQLHYAVAAAGDDEREGRQALVVVLPPRQRDESRALLARALALAAPGAVVLAVQANDEGARSLQADLSQLAGAVEHLSKHKCRVVWCRRDDAAIDAALLAQWRALDDVRTIADGAWLSRPGLFAWDRVDAGSALLAAQLPPELAGRAADLGAGYGYLACELVRHCPGIAAVDLYEAEARALDPARGNLARLERPVEAHLHWHDVAAGLQARYDVIVSNPPIHQGRAEQPALGRRFIEVAADALEPAGQLWLVANRHLPYEATLAARFDQVRTVVDRHGYKVMHAVGPRR
jgi:16S rRNA (guanine1207-N2)-methyltransferase